MSLTVVWSAQSRLRNKDTSLKRLCSGNNIMNGCFASPTAQRRGSPIVQQAELVPRVVAQAGQPWVARAELPQSTACAAADVPGDEHKA